MNININYKWHKHFFLAVYKMKDEVPNIRINMSINIVLLVEVVRMAFCFDNGE